MAGRLLVLRSKPVYGPDHPFPAHLAGLLEEWNKENGAQLPPCKSQPWSYTMKWKTFDRQGNEVDLSCFAVKQPAPYKVLVLHPVEGPAKIVSCYFPFGTKYGTYLVTWLGTEDCWEPTSCAVRKFFKGPNNVVYEPEARSAFEKLAKRRPGYSRQDDTSSSSQPPTSGTRRQRNSLPGGSQTQGPVARPQRNSLPGRPGVALNSRTYDEDSEEESSEEEQPESALKRRRVTGPTAAMHGDPKDREEHFDKARIFFQLFDKNVEVKIFSCQTASQRVQQYIFEGSEGEFALLVDHVKSLKDTNETVTVEVGHVLALNW
ncbi:hypothetical protein BBP40_006803 [Aspergillus hancockii]|nr:hypothetical protein BBP40_006803 [Aspergillus hancockii]